MTIANNKSRVVITGVGLTAPNGNNLTEFRQALLTNISGVVNTEVRHMGIRPAGICNFDETKYLSKKHRRRGTRAGSIGVYCAHESLIDAKIDLKNIDRSRVGIYVGITEHGNVETENEIHQLYQNKLDYTLWSIHHNPRTVANNPAGEITINADITGPHLTIGAACAAGNVGLIYGMQMLQLGEVDIALAGGISESPATFGIFAAFNSQGALASNVDPTMASRPLDTNRNGIVIAEGGCLFTLERLDDALLRGAKIYGEIVGHHTNSDATDFVLPNPERQIECMHKAIARAGLTPAQIDIVNLHATGTTLGDIQECEAVQKVFGDSTNTKINCTKGFIGHAMGAAGALELAGNLLSFEDGLVHPCMNIKDIDPKCDLPGLVKCEPIQKKVETIFNNSFGMLGINSSVIIKKYKS
jgi:3-oxoacyl-[acyl-carrier-protein] synthase II